MRALFKRGGIAGRVGSLCQAASRSVRAPRSHSHASHVGAGRGSKRTMRLLAVTALLLLCSRTGTELTYTYLLEKCVMGACLLVTERRRSADTLDNQHLIYC